MLGTLLSSAVSWTPGVHTLGWCRAPVLRTASLLLSANSASMGGDEVQPVSLDGFFSFFNTLSAAFNRFDLDGDGTITTAEIGAVLRECGETPSDGEVAQLVAQFDDNNNGTVDFDEFCALVTRSRSDSVNSQVESKVAEIAREAIATDEGAAGAPLQQTGADGGMANALHRAHVTHAIVVFLEREHRDAGRHSAHYTPQRRYSVWTHGRQLAWLRLLERLARHVKGAATLLNTHGVAWVINEEMDANVAKLGHHAHAERTERTSAFIEGLARLGDAMLTFHAHSCAQLLSVEARRAAIIEANIAAASPATTALASASTAGGAIGPTNETQLAAWLLREQSYRLMLAVRRATTPLGTWLAVPGVVGGRGLKRVCEEVPHVVRATRHPFRTTVS